MSGDLIGLILVAWLGCLALGVYIADKLYSYETDKDEFTAMAFLWPLLFAIALVFGIILLIRRIIVGTFKFIKNMFINVVFD